MDFHIELVQLKQELLTEIKKLDTKFAGLREKESPNVPEEILTPLDKINIMLKKTEEMFHAITEQQIKLDKITELEIFKNRTNDTVIAHDIRIKYLSKDLEDIKFKYDREITQNLTVPGFIGGACRFKTISEYLLFNMDDITKLKMEKELMKKEEKDLKSKLDSMLKNTLILVDNSVTRSNLYTDNKQKYIVDDINNKYKDFNDKLMEMKALTLSNEKFVKEELLKINKLASELNYLKENVETVLDKKLNEIKSTINEFKSKIDKINIEVKKNHKNIDIINNTLKNKDIFNNNIKGDKNKYNSNKKIAFAKNADINKYNYNIRNNKNNNLKRANDGEKNYINEIINSRYSRNSDSFKKLQDQEINKYSNKNIVEKNNSNEFFYKLENKKDINEKLNHIIKENNNIRTHNELKYKMKPKYLDKKEKNINQNSKDKNESYSIEGKMPTERKRNNLENNHKKERMKEKQIYVNDKINLSDGEKEKQNVKVIRKNKNLKEKKINKYKLIKIEKNQTNDKAKAEDFEKNIITHTDYNFFNRKKINEFHFFKDEIYNLKRYPLHRIKTYNNENSEENNKKANSDINLDINTDDNSSNKLITSQKLNTIYYPNEEMIKNLKHKDYFIKQFLIRHNNTINKSDTKLQKILINDENNKMFETNNNFYNNTNVKNRYNTLDKINTPPPLINGSESNGPTHEVQTQSNIYKRNNQIREKLNFKFISLDNQFKIALHKKNLQYRNDPDILFSTPMTKIFKTFQVRKNKDITNYLNQ